MAVIMGIARTLATALAASAFGALPALGQAYPAKPVKLITQFAPGSSGDTVLRTVTGPLGELLGQPIIVENQSGGGGVVAAQMVARAAPDGYTIMGGTASTQVIRRFMTKGALPFDPVKDFTPVTQLIQSVTIVVANPQWRIGSFKELVEYARANPGKIAYGTSGIGSEHHLSGEQIKQLAKVDMLHVPYKASMQGLLDVAAGRIPMAFAIYAVAMPQAKAGKVNLLAVVREKRTPLLPDVPTIAEVVPGFEPPPSWVGLLGPANLPAPVVKRLAGDTQKSLAQPETRQKLESQGLDVVGSSPEEFAATIRRQTELVARIVEAAKIQPNE